MIRFIGVVIGAVLLSAPGRAAQSQSALDSASAALIATHAFEAFAPVGLSVAVVANGDLIHAQGYGVRKLGEGIEIDTDTLFPIASLTKAFTTAALAILVDEGKVGWDDKVIDHLPDFRMADAWVTREFTVRDLLTHRSGLGRGAGDLLFWPDGKATRGEVVKALRHLQPETSFRTTYAYDNLLYIVAGELIGKVSGTPWEDFVETRLFKPLGMVDCRALVAHTAGATNKATQHGRVDGAGAATPLPDDPDEPTSSAGSIWCSANSMSKWVRFMLSKGVASDGSRVISEEQMRELFEPVTLTRTPAYMRSMGRTHFSAYALGWKVSDFHGHLLVSHSGLGMGTASYIALLPELNSAVVVMSNDYTNAPSTLAIHLVDALIREKPHDWVGMFSRASKQMREADLQESEAPGDEAPPHSALPLASFSGTYRDAWYGDVIVSLSDTKLTIDMTRSKALTGTLTRQGDQRFLARWYDRTLNADAYVVFETAPDGTVASMKMSAVSSSTDFSFDFHDLNLIKQ